MGSLPLDTAILASLFIGCVLYGVFLVLFSASVYCLIWRRKTSRPNYVLVMASIVLFCILTAHEGAALARGFNAFIVYRDTIGPDAYLVQFWRGEYLAWGVLVSGGGLVADCILMYRCWIVWGGSLRVLVMPFVLFVCQAVLLPFAALTQTTITSLDAVCSESISKWVLVSVALEVVQNVATTLLIAWRIWSVNRAARGSNNGELMRVVSLVVESGAVYTATVLVLLGTAASGSCALYIWFEIVSNMLGITFSLLIVRVAISSSHNHAMPSSTSHLPSNSTGSTSTAPPPIVTVEQSMISDPPLSEVPLYKGLRKHPRRPSAEGDPSRGV